jgi:hypothetical protein
MGIEIVRPQDRQLQSVDPASIQGKIPDAAIAKSKRQIVSTDNPYVHIAQTAANNTIPRHSHSTPEVMVVLSGRVNVGGTECEAGSVLLIPANEEYALEVGDDDLTFLVVRPTVASFQDHTA